MAHENYIDPSVKSKEEIPVTDQHRSKSLTINGHASQQGVEKDKAKQ